MIARQHKALEGFRKAVQLHRARRSVLMWKQRKPAAALRRAHVNWSRHQRPLNLTLAMRSILPELANHSSHWSHSFYERGCQEKTLPRRRGQLDFSGVL